MNKIDNNIKLSICIPTYNRADFLVKTLSVISKQLMPEVEIVISNNGSSDGTEKLVKDFIEKHEDKNITLLNQKKNIGFDKNVLAVVEAAQGEYCWLLSDDDLLMPSAIENILNLLNSKSNLSLCVINYSRFDVVQNKITKEKMISLLDDINTDNFNDFYFTPTPQGYFLVLGTNMITMSVNIFKRQSWQEQIKTVDEFIGYNFIHIFILTKMISKYPKLYFMTNPQIQYLCNNHREWDNDIWKDYKNVFLPYLIELGFDKEKVHAIIKSSINFMTFKQKIYKIIHKVLP